MKSPAHKIATLVRLGWNISETQYAHYCSHFRPLNAWYTSSEIEQRTGVL